MSEPSDADLKRLTEVMEVDARQLAAGYVRQSVVGDGIDLVFCEFTVVRKLANGNYLVVSPR